MRREEPADAFRFVSAVVLTCAVAATATPATLRGVYTADWLHNTRGGLRTGSAYLQNVELIAQHSFDNPASGRPARALAYLLYNDATVFSERLSGDVQTVSNIDAIEALRVYELWYEQPFAERWSARFGLYDLNSEFDAIDAASLFINSAHGIGTDFGETGVAGPSIFPVTGLGARVEWQANPQHTLRYVVLDGVPGDPDDPSRTTIDLGSDQGVLHTAEWDWRGERMRLAAGYWRYSAEFAHIDRIDAAGRPSTGTGNDGFYVLTEFVAGAAGPQGGELRWFARYGRADDAFNEFGEYLGLGVVLDGAFGIPDSALGLAVARATLGHTFRKRPDITRDTRETAFELTWRIRITPWLELQPDIQYIVNPGTDPGLDNALVFGIRFALAASIGR